MKHSKAFIKNTFITLVGQSLTLILAFGSSIVIARVLGPKGQGIYALAVLLPTLLIAFTNIGIGPATVYHIGKKAFTMEMVL